MRTAISRRAALTILAAGTLLHSPPVDAARNPSKSACTPLPPDLPAPDSLPAVTELPDPFAFYDGARMSSPDQWACRREQLHELVQHYEYGHLPPGPTDVTAVRDGDTLTVTVTVAERSASFNATLTLPEGSGPFPAFIAPNPLSPTFVSRGYAVVNIDLNSIASDSTEKSGAFWELYSASDVDTGVLMAWAWGFHRTLDALSAVAQVDTSRVGVTGFSRYGKAALVAGAFDERIALTVPSSSGTAGMGNYRFFFATGEDNETLEDITNAFPFWFTQRFAEFRNQANRLPIDQNSVAALVAPRALLTTNGTDDIRTNPQGASLTYRAAKMVYQYIGAKDRIGVHFRPGGHFPDPADDEVILDFADKHLMGKEVSRDFDNNPYPNDPAAIPWTIPAQAHW